MTQTTLMDMKTIQALIESDMQKVNAEILAQLNSDVALINQLGFYIIQGGGKRIRPLIALLAARAINYQGDLMPTCAAFIEFIHTASLLHDDVVDESDMRRGRATANAEFGNAASVLVGDFIYTRAFQLVAKLQSLKMLDAVLYIQYHTHLLQLFLWLQSCPNMSSVQPPDWYNLHRIPFSSGLRVFPFLHATLLFSKDMA